MNIPKPYDDSQIHAALTQIIDDKNEFITDKYGRDGKLVNIGEYYLFQPIELRNKEISIFDRSVPIDYKHNMINFEIKKDIAKPAIAKPVIAKQAIEKRNISNTLQQDSEERKETNSEVYEEGKKVLGEMTANLNIAREFNKLTKVPRGDDNWFKHCGIVMKNMSKEFPESSPYLIEFLVSHMIEQLLFEDKLELMNYLYSLENIEMNSIEWFSKEYFVKHSIKSRQFEAIILYKLSKRMIMVLDENNKWIEASPEDQREIAGNPETKKLLTFNVADFNKLVGFIGYEKSNKYLVFKTKDMLSKRDTGARCDEAGKDKTIKKINEIVGEEKYTSENTKAQKDADGTVVKEAVGQMELCVMEEFILRYFETIEKDGKRWFLTPEMAIYFKLYTIHVNF